MYIIFNPNSTLTMDFRNFLGGILIFFPILFSFVKFNLKIIIEISFTTLLHLSGVVFFFDLLQSGFSLCNLLLVVFMVCNTYMTTRFYQRSRTSLQKEFTFREFIASICKFIASIKNNPVIMVFVFFSFILSIGFRYCLVSGMQFDFSTHFVCSLIYVLFNSIFYFKCLNKYILLIFMFRTLYIHPSLVFNDIQREFSTNEFNLFFIFVLLGFSVRASVLAIFNTHVFGTGIKHINFIGKKLHTFYYSLGRLGINPHPISGRPLLSAIN